MGLSIKGAKKFAKESAGAIEGFLEQFAPFPNVRLSSGVSGREESIMSFRLPSGTSVKMYINPQNLQISDSKQIVPIRTKGGYVVQYWGANLTQITISGTTGSSGIRGINILRDVYNAENRAFDLVASSQVNELISVLGASGVDPSNPGDFLPEVSARLRERQFILRPSLASLALSVIMYYQGIQYKGFFTSFNTTESVDNLGLFDYTMAFSATEQRGVRNNFMAWHKEPLADDAAGLLLNGVANAARRFIGVGEEGPQNFYPTNAPLTFGGNSTAGVFGFDTNLPAQRNSVSIIP
jgi:hypothetical protein